MILTSCYDQYNTWQVWDYHSETFGQEDVSWLWGWSKAGCSAGTLFWTLFRIKKTKFLILWHAYQCSCFQKFRAVQMKYWIFKSHYGRVWNVGLDKKNFFRILNCHFQLTEAGFQNHSSRSLKILKKLSKIWKWSITGYAYKVILGLPANQVVL